MKIRLGGKFSKLGGIILIAGLLSGCVRGMNGAGQPPFSFGQKSQLALIETTTSAENTPKAGTPNPSPLQITPTPKESPTPAPPVLYYTQAGDTLNALTARFGVSKEEITSTQTLSEHGMLDPGILLIIPNKLSETTSSEQVMPDSEIVFSPSALDFDINQYVKDAGGYLTTIQEWHTNGWNSGAASVYKVSIDNSINPRLLLAILEYQSHWVTGQPANLAQTDFPVGYLNYQKKGLFAQLSWAVQQLNIGYYGWREGRLTGLTFQDGTTIRLAPDLNAGSVAILYLFSQLYDQPHWAAAVYGPESMPALYEKMFGNPWIRAQSVEPLFPATLAQPPMELPFQPGKPWSLTGGPHSAWGPDGARAALDFAPSTTEKDCYVSSDWVTAISSGMVVRSEYGVVVVDLDGDGFEQTGWAVLYLHIATDRRVPANTWVNTDDRIGHPSCEGGQATGTHVHIARKYNGEWILADGPMPFVLSGWRAIAGEKPYQGALIKDEKTVKASIYGDYSSLISR